MLHRRAKGRQRGDNEAVTPEGPSLSSCDFMEVKRARWA